MNRTTIVIIIFLVFITSTLHAGKKEKALYNAIEAANLKKVKYLVKKGADVNSLHKFWKCKEECSLPIIAITGNRLKIAKFLFEKGANVNPTFTDPGNSYPKDISALQLVFYYRNSMQTLNKDELALAKLLIKKGADVNRVDTRNQQNTLMMVMRSGDPEIIKMALDKTKNIKLKDRNGLTALMHARNAENSLVLIKKGADVNALDKKGRTPLFYSHSPEKITLLIKHGADVNVVDINGYTPLMTSSNPASIKLLVAAGAKIDAVKNNGETALHDAADCSYCRESDIALVKVLLKSGASVKIRNKYYGFTPLLKASDKKSSKGKTDIVKLLIKHGANINEVDKQKRTAMILQIRKTKKSNYKDSISIIKVLLKNGADPNAQDKRGWTVMHHGAYHNLPVEVIATLVKGGAKINARNKIKQTPLEIAKRRSKHIDMKKIIKAIKKYGGTM